jgi:hypothetical protein
MHNIPHSEETKRKISLTKKGCIPWNYGLPCSEETKQKISSNNGCYWLGKKLPEEYKRKISLALKGKSSGMKGKHHSSKTKQKIGLAVKGKNHPMFNKYHSKESKQKMSLTRGGTGIPYEFSRYPAEYFRIRTTILKRDNHICQYCFKYGKAVHHIDHNKKNNDPSNLLTLCCSCNIKEISIWNKTR